MNASPFYPLLHVCPTAAFGSTVGKRWWFWPAYTVRLADRMITFYGRDTGRVSVRGTVDDLKRWLFYNHTTRVLGNRFVYVEYCHDATSVIGAADEKEWRKNIAFMVCVKR